MTISKTHIPVALAKRAEAAAKSKVARLVAQAKEDIALIMRRRADISEAFYDIGEALIRLKPREVVGAMGCRSFSELCEKHISISSSQAERLVDIVSSMSRVQALSVGPTKAASIVALMRAAPNGETVSDLLSHGVRIRGKVFNVKTASSRAIARATSEIRRKRPANKRSATTEEHASCNAVEKALRELGAKDAKVTVKAGRVAGSARATIELLVEDIPLLRKAARV